MEEGPLEGAAARAEPAEELAELGRALSAELERAGRRGLRRLRPTPSAPLSRPAPRVAEPVAAPARTAPAPTPADSPTPLGPARSAGEVRAQAAGARTLEELAARVARCEACALARTRTQTVFSDGEGTARLMFVGEAPGAEEDRTGVPFVGRAGQLLSDIITKGVRIERREAYIANVLKCRPPDNRDPTAEEKELCTPWLDRQIELVDPAVLIPLGRHAAMHLLAVEAPMGAMRGKVHERKGRKLVPTFHPAFLLRSPGMKKECWSDIQLAMGLLGRDPRASAESERSAPER